jgi:hypothetical protein
MSVTYTNRQGKTHHLHTGPKRGGSGQHYFSTKSTGQLADGIPAGFKLDYNRCGVVHSWHDNEDCVHASGL